MVLFPHKHNSLIQVPLKRGYESFDDVPKCVQKAFELLAVLWERHEHDEDVEKLFMKQKLLAYSTRKGDRMYSAPFLHNFYILTNEGLKWLQDKYSTKHACHIELVGSLPEFKALEQTFINTKGPSLIPIIFYDPSFTDCHVSACAFLKNDHGMHFFYLDSIARETSIFKHAAVKDLLDPRMEYYVNVEKRQVDGFNCRIEAFILLKSISRFFEKNHQLKPTDLFSRIDPSERLDNENKVFLKGAFLKTAQVIISDHRKKELVASKDISLESLQDLFGIKYLLHHESISASSVELSGSCVYLQCKALKYVLQFIAENKKAKAEAEKKYVFSLAEEF
jgi:hypothetical protein